MSGRPDSGERGSGEHFVEQALGELQRRREAGACCFALFDLDNTLFDTRYRTLHVAKRFDEEQASRHFAGLHIGQVGLDGARTYRQLGGTDGGLELRFQRFWSRVFWEHASFEHDQPVQAMVHLVHRAHQSGAVVRFLTGRVEDFAAQSLGQLRRAGLDFATAHHIRSKPRRELWTVEFKLGVLRELAAQGWLAWYVTESRYEIATLQRLAPSLPLMLLDCSLERDGPQVAPGTPMLAACF